MTIDYRQQVLGSALQQAANVPKEIGLLQRVDGILNGVEEIRNRVQNFYGRVHGEPGSPPISTGDRVVEPGLPTKLTMIENEIRSCLATLGSLHDSF